MRNLELSSRAVDSLKWKGSLTYTGKADDAARDEALIRGRLTIQAQSRRAPSIWWQNDERKPRIGLCMASRLIAALPRSASPSYRPGSTPRRRICGPRQSAGAPSMPTDSPRVTPETRCESKSWEWWPGTDSNHRHADFQNYPGTTHRSRRNRLSRVHRRSR